MKSAIYFIIGVLSVFAVWISFSFIFSPALVPYPADVLIKIPSLVAAGGIAGDMLITFSRSLSGFVIAFILGTAIGILSGSFLSLEKTFFVPVALLQGAPPMLWIIPVMLILGTEGFSPVAVVFLVCLPLVIINIQEGRKSISRNMFDMFRIYADSRMMKLKELILPSLSPYLKSILFLGMILALKSSIIGEWFGAKNGVGRKINEYFYTFDMVSFYATSFIFLLVTGIIAMLSKKVGDTFIPAKKISKISPSAYGVLPEHFGTNETSMKMTDVSFSYGMKKILSNVDIEIGTGDIIVLTGDSGAGKTTFGKLSTGILKSHSGTVMLPSNPGFLFQDDALLGYLDCYGNASLPARWKKKHDTEKITRYFLEKCGLKNCENMFPDELSGGMKKRLAFARALILNPDFMVLDEPFNNLHKEARRDLWNLYFELFASRDIPSLIITHYPEELSGRNVKIFELKDRALIKK